ncbi:MAG: DUF167 domain-containing protein [Pseudobdellovibrio sp.]
MITEIPGGIRIALYVQPNASKTEIIGPYNNSLKIKIHAPPVDGKANDEIIYFFSKLLKIPKKNISLLHGDLGRNKVIEILGCTKTLLESFF